jgi:periplasmic protein TonB
MTLSIKDSIESASQTKPGRTSQNSENKSGQSPRSNPVCLEVAVTIRSLPGEDGDASGSSAPIREEGRTVIVFDNGAVLRLANNLPAGQKVILSRAQGRDVVCRVVEGRNLPTVKGYIEIEFLEQFNDFWRIHQTPEQVNAPPPPAPVFVSPPPAAVAQPAAPPVPPVAAPRAVAREKESASQSGGAPSFEDIAGIVRMSPAPASGVKGRVPAAQPVSSKSNSDVSQAQNEPVRPLSTTGTFGSISDAASGDRTIPAAQEYSSSPIQRPASSSDFMTRGMLATGQTSAGSSDVSRGRMPLIVGGLALVLVGFGVGYFLMHRGNAPSTPVPVAAVQPSAPLTPAQTSEVAPTPAPQPAAEQPAPQPQAVSAIAAVTPGAEIPSSSSEQKSSPAGKSTEAVQPDRPSKQRQQIPNLKMATPSAPKRDLAKLSDGSAPSVTDISSAVAVGSSPIGSMMSPVMRAENQPASPPPPVSSAPVSRIVREPRLISTTRPIYPAVARQSSTQGTVVVSAEVDAKGSVTSAKAISGPATLREAAIDSVKQWKYSPALIDGKPITTQVTVNVQFRLN